MMHDDRANCSSFGSDLRTRMIIEFNLQIYSYMLYLN